MTLNKSIISGLIVWLMFMGMTPLAHAGSGPADILVVFGTVTNDQGKPLKEASLQFFLNGNKIDIEKKVTTSNSGRYEAELTLHKGALASAKVELAAEKPTFKSSDHIVLEHIVREKDDINGLGYFLAHHNFILNRVITPAFWIASLVLIAVYALIAFELMHRTLAAFLGASILLTITYTAGSFNPNYVILTYEEAIQAIDMNVIFLLMAMMIIVGVMKKTGIFQWMAYKSYQMAKGNVFVLAAILMFFTAVTSAFLDNVTTMLLIIPVTIEIALTLKINPISLLMPEVFASNVGGTAPDRRSAQYHDRIIRKIVFCRFYHEPVPGQCHRSCLYHRLFSILV